MGTMRLANGFTLTQGASNYATLGGWINVGSIGLYSAGVNGAHIYPNAASDYGAWRMNGSRNGYGGIAFEVGGHYNVLMSNASNMGFYDDNNNEWMIQAVVNGQVNLFYNGVSKLSTSSGGITVAGGVTLTGKITAASKSFVIDHPIKDGKKLEHGSLEGPENGVYVRGKCESNVIELPDYWTGLVDEDTITVQITPVGGWQKLYVKKIEDNKVYVGKFGFGSPKFFYNVYGERKDIEKMEVEY